MVVVDLALIIFLSLLVSLSALLWFYEHPPKNRGKKTGRGGDFE